MGGGVERDPGGEGQYKSWQHIYLHVRPTSINNEPPGIFCHINIHCFYYYSVFCQMFAIMWIFQHKLHPGSVQDLGCFSFIIQLYKTHNSIEKQGKLLTARYTEPVWIICSQEISRICDFIRGVEYGRIWNILKYGHRGFQYAKCFNSYINM